MRLRFLFPFLMLLLLPVFTVGQSLNEILNEKDRIIGELRTEVKKLKLENKKLKSRIENLRYKLGASISSSEGDRLRAELEEASQVRDELENLLDGASKKLEVITEASENLEGQLYIAEQQIKEANVQVTSLLTTIENLQKNAETLLKNISGFRAVHPVQFEENHTDNELRTGDGTILLTMLGGDNYAYRTPKKSSQKIAYLYADIEYRVGLDSCKSEGYAIDGFICVFDKKSREFLAHTKKEVRLDRKNEVSSDLYCTYTHPRRAFFFKLNKEIDLKVHNELSFIFIRLKEWDDITIEDYRDIDICDLEKALFTFPPELCGRR